jgi:hypothetical protein
MAGATTETTNGVVGLIYNNDNTPAPNTIVTLLTFDYNPVADTSVNNSIYDTTDSKGEFAFNDILPGKYAVLARNKAASTGVLVRGIDVNDDLLTKIPPVNLEKTGSISTSFSGQVSINSGSYLYIPGTDIYAYVENESHITLDEIPSGTFPEVIIAETNGKRFNVLRNEIVVDPEQVIVIDNPLWKYSRQITLNTSSSGAAINADLYNFPILLRFNSTNFNFTQAQPGGADLIVAGKNGKALPVEIERWNNVSAEVWVSVDTILGNNADQTITMYWGNGEITSRTVDNVVFDTAYGFHSVWHLSESSDTVHDASTNGFRGIRSGPVQRSAGIIANGQTFTDSGAYFEMGNICNPGNHDLTISTWVKRDTTGLQTLFAQSDGGKPSSTYGWSFSFDMVDNIHFYAATAGSTWGNTGSFGFWGKSEKQITDTTTWHYVAVIIKRSGNDGCRCYIDGIDVTDMYEGTIAGVGAISNQLPFIIGAESDTQYPFSGSIDECTISYTARSEAWIRLCFINQGPNDKLTVFK